MNGLSIWIRAFRGLGQNESSLELVQSLTPSEIQKRFDRLHRIVQEQSIVAPNAPSTGLKQTVGKHESEQTQQMSFETRKTHWFDCSGQTQYANPAPGPKKNTDTWNRLNAFIVQLAEEKKHELDESNQEEMTGW